jgi:AcrR family transcriptional regulator
VEQGVLSEPRRRDARRNREAILAAARALFAESADVPMCEIARRAGVGQGTLYRHFPDRSALAAEVLGEQVSCVARLAAEHDGDPDAFFLLLRALIQSTIYTYAVGELARVDPQVDSRLQQERLRIAAFMRRPLHDAKAAGTLRRDATLDDVFLVVLMARGAMTRAEGPAGRAAAAARVIALACEGLVPADRPAGRALGVPAP